MKLLTVFVFSVFVLFYACDFNKDNHTELMPENFLPDSNSVVLEFSIFVNQDEYELTNYGEAPQLAIWLENRDSTQVRTVWVSHRAGKNDLSARLPCLIGTACIDSRKANSRSGISSKG